MKDRGTQMGIEQIKEIINKPIDIAYSPHNKGNKHILSLAQRGA
jgi:hypothetical protein